MKYFILILMLTTSGCAALKEFENLPYEEKVRRWEAAMRASEEAQARFNYQSTNQQQINNNQTVSCTSNVIGNYVYTNCR